jgi:hypothetical protein
MMTRTAEPRLEELSPGAAAAAVREQIDATDLRSFARSSPAKLITVGLVLLGLCLVAGVVTASQVSSRQHALDNLLGSAEPDANSAQRLYTSLSVADAEAGTAFIFGGLEPQGVLDAYNQAIGEASAELVAQSSGSSNSGNDPDIALRTGIATNLPVYAELIQTARTNNRLGHPVGSAYLSEASNLMQTKMLPMAQELQEHRTSAIAAIQRRHVRPPWLAIILPIVALAALVTAQVYLARRWRRLLNPGLLVASCILVILLAWTVTAGLISALSTTDGRDNGAVPNSELMEGRILTQQARAAETLKLVRRDDSGDYDRTFDTATTKLTDLLTHYSHSAPATDDVATARTALDRWRAAHQRMNDALGRGDFPGGAAIAIGPGSTQATASVSTLDGSLVHGIAMTRNTLRDNTSSAARSLDVLSSGAITLAVLAGLCMVGGLWPRLREYR